MLFYEGTPGGRMHNAFCPLTRHCKVNPLFTLSTRRNAIYPSRLSFSCDALIRNLREFNGCSHKLYSGKAPDAEGPQGCRTLLTSCSAGLSRHRKSVAVRVKNACM